MAATGTRAEVRKQVGKIHVVEGELLAAAAVLTRPLRRRTEFLALRLRAECVIGRALFRILEGLVGLGDFLEARLGLRLLGDIRMIFLRQPAVSLLDLVGEAPRSTPSAA